MAVYDADLARIHAEGFADRFDGAAEWLAGLAGMAGRGGRVFDIGCGDGRMLAALAARGVQGAGLDLSPAFVARAVARGLSVARGDAAHPPLPAGTTLVTALGEVLSYIGADGRAALDGTIAAAAATLPAGGHLVFDLIGPGVPEQAGWRDGDGWLIASRSERAGDVLTRRIVTFVEDDGIWRRGDTTHRQHILAPSDVAQRLAAAGFDVDMVDRFGAAELLPGRQGWVARRRRDTTARP